MSANRPSESPQRVNRPLIRLAKMCSIATSYVGQSNDYHEIDDDVLITVLASLGVDASSDAATQASIERITRECYVRPVPPTIVCTESRHDVIAVSIPVGQVPEADITLENGAAYAGALSIRPARHA